jgi:plastocyanin
MMRPGPHPQSRRGNSAPARRPLRTRLGACASRRAPAWVLCVLAVCSLCLSGTVAIGATARASSRPACHRAHHGRCAAHGARHTAGHRHRHKRHAGPHATARHSTPLAPTTNGSSLPGTTTAPAGSSGSPSGSETPSSTEDPAGGSESGGSGGEIGEEGSGSAAPARVQVTAREFSFTLSRPAVATSKVTIELVNGGQDEHNLHIRPASGGPDVGAFPTTQAGRHLDETFNLAPGAYTFYCSMPAHEGLGMKATFTVQ